MNEADKVNENAISPPPISPNRAKFTLPLIAGALVALLVGSFLVSQQLSQKQPSKDITATDTESATSFQHATLGFRFTPSDDWTLIDVGLPVEWNTMIEAKEEQPVVIYLTSTKEDAVMDLQVYSEVVSEQVQGVDFTNYETKNGYKARIHSGNCSVFDEPRIILSGNDKETLFVMVDELCEEEEWKTASLENLVNDITESFEFDND